MEGVDPDTVDPGPAPGEVGPRRIGRCARAVYSEMQGSAPRHFSGAAWGAWRSGGGVPIQYRENGTFW